MRFIFTVLLTVAIGIIVLRSELTPWRIVNRADLEAKAPAVVQRTVVVPAAPREDHSGDWMHDPNYRSALEKTTLAGHPEGAFDRDHSKPQPTPFKHP